MYSDSGGVKRYCSRSRDPPREKRQERAEECGGGDGWLSQAEASLEW